MQQVMLLVMLVVKESSLVVVLGLKPDSPAHRKPHGGLSSSGARRWLQTLLFTIDLVFSETLLVLIESLLK